MSVVDVRVINETLSPKLLNLADLKHVPCHLKHLFNKKINNKLNFPRGSVSKESACNVGDLVRSLDWEDPLEEGMAIHSSTLAWRFSQTEEPGRPQSMGSQRARHN